MAYPHHGACNAEKGQKVKPGPLFPDLPVFSYLENMKQVIFVVLWCSLLAVSAQKGLVFNKLSYTQTLQQAEKEHKPVLLYFHFTGCGACLHMEKTTFSEKRVGDFYNAGFICHEVNTTTPAGEKTNRIYNITAQPAYIFLDPDGQIIHKGIGVFKPDSFNLLGRDALDPARNLAGLKRRLPSMLHDSTFMFQYCCILRDMSAIDSAAVNGYLATQTNLGNEKNLRFLYEFSLINYELMVGPAELRLMAAHRKELYRYFDSASVEGRLVWINSFIIQKAIKYQNASLFAEAQELMRPYYNGREYSFVEMDGQPTGMMISSRYGEPYDKMEYMAAGTDVAAYQAARKQYLDAIWNNSGELNNYAWYIYENSNNGERLKKALECAQRSVTLDRNKYNQDTYAKLRAKLNKK
jgi:thioredoxin-related protein